jgi:DNA-binding LacI/PurR family transcriptional regulator
MATDQVRQLDIARRAGVSRSTVTRALKDDPMIAEATRVAVQRIADELGYIPNTLGRALATGYHPVIGLVLLHGFYFGMEGISQALRETDWALQLVLASGPPERDIAAVRELLARRVAGFLFRLGFEETLPRAVDIARARQVPVVLEGMPIPYDIPGKPGKVAQVTFDFDRGLEEVVCHLAGQGHTHIGLIYHAVTCWPRAFQRAVEAVGVQGQVAAIDTSPDGSLASLLDGAWSGAHRPTALILSSLPLAIQFDRYRVQYGLRVPDDLAVMMIQYHTLWVAGIHENYPYLIFDDVDAARTAVRVLLEMIDGTPTPAAPVLVPGYLRLPSQPFFA